VYTNTTKGNDHGGGKGTQQWRQTERAMNEYSERCWEFLIWLHAFVTDLSNAMRPVVPGLVRKDLCYLT
jgi:hypothetical protein